MRNLAVVTVTALLSATALSAGPAAARSSEVHLLGGLHLKRVDLRTGQSHTTYLLCTSSSRHGDAPVIRGVGGLRDATSACEELAAVHGRLDDLAVHPQWMAPSLEAPVEVRAAGTWEGARVSWSHRYSNGGWLAKATGDVFGF